MAVATRMRTRPDAETHRVGEKLMVTGSFVTRSMWYVPEPPTPRRRLSMLRSLANCLKTYSA